MVLDLFLRELPVEWEIYVQPHLNGLRPDFVLLNPAVGIAVFKVKDWDLDALHYFVAVERHDGPVLMARDANGVEFNKQRENPVRAVNRYKQSIHEIYCPRIRGKGSFGVVTAGVIFPFADTGRVKALLAPFMTDVLDTRAAPYHPISGVRDVAQSIIRSVFPEVGRQDSSFSGSRCDLAKSGSSSHPLRSSASSGTMNLESCRPTSGKTDRMML